MKPDLIRLEDVMRRTGRGRSWIYEAVKNETFPQPVPGGSRCTRWVSTEVDAWVHAQIAGRTGDAGQILVSEETFAKMVDVKVPWLQKDRQGAQLIPFVKLGVLVRYDVVKARAVFDGLTQGGPQPRSAARPTRPSV